MALNVTCPNCRARFTLPDSLKGKRIRCKTCDHSFVAGAGQIEALTVTPVDEEDLIQEERPFSRRPNQSERKERPWPAPNEEDAAVRSGHQESGVSNAQVLLILGGAALVLVLVIACAGIPAYWFLFRQASSADTPAQVQEEIKPSEDNPPPPAAGNPMAPIVVNPPPLVFNPPAAINPLVFPPAGPPKEIITQAIEDLQSPNLFTRKGAAERLRQIKPNERRLEVVLALEPLLDDPDHFTRQEAIMTYGTWAGKDGVPALLKLLSNSDVFTRRTAEDALGAVKDERAADPLAQMLGSFPDRDNSSRALQAMGPVAEKAVIKQVQDQNLDWAARSEACKILKVIGTKESLPVLQAAAQDQQFFVANAAKDALTALANPVAPGGNPALVPPRPVLPVQPAFGPDQTIRLCIQIPNPDNWPAIQNQLRALADDAKPSLNLDTISGSSYWVTLAPVRGSPADFARKIKFGKVIAIHVRQRLIYVDPL